MLQLSLSTEVWQTTALSPLPNTICEIFKIVGMRRTAP